MKVFKNLKDLEEIDWKSDEVDDGLWVLKNRTNRPLVIIRRDFGEGDYRVIEIDNGLTMNNHLANEEFNVTQLGILLKNLFIRNNEIRFYENDEWKDALNWLTKTKEL